MRSADRAARGDRPGAASSARRASTPSPSAALPRCDVLDRLLAESFVEPASPGNERVIYTGRHDARRAGRSPGLPPRRRWRRDDRRRGRSRHGAARPTSRSSRIRATAPQAAGDACRRRHRRRRHAGVRAAAAAGQHARSWRSRVPSRCSTRRRGRPPASARTRPSRPTPSSIPPRPSARSSPSAPGPGSAPAASSTATSPSAPAASSAATASSTPTSRSASGSRSATA